MNSDGRNACDTDHGKQAQSVKDLLPGEDTMRDKF